MQPLVSILIPAYNAEAWLADTLKSAVGQTWQKKEIIVVDDGSKDQTLAVAQQFAQAGVKVVSQANQGAAAARNKAFSLSKGAYIQWLDADDLLAPDKIERQMQAAAHQPGERKLFSACWGRFIYRTKKAQFCPTSLWADLSPREWLLRKMDENLYMQTATWLVSRQLTEAAGPWDTRLLGDDDGEYFCRVIKASDGIIFVPQAKTFYRISGASSLSYVGKSNKKLDAQFLACRLHVDCLRSLGDDQKTREVCVKYLQRYLIYYYPERPDLVVETERLVQSLGGKIEIPRMPKKYAWLQKAFGWRFAKQLQLSYNQIKSNLRSSLDKSLYYLEK